jgi:hypothetical protein
MSTRNWRNSATQPRTWARRTRGRRASDRRLRLETVLSAICVLAWAWCAYELAVTFIR